MALTIRLKRSRRSPYDNPTLRIVRLDDTVYTLATATALLDRALETGTIVEFLTYMEPRPMPPLRPGEDWQSRPTPPPEKFSLNPADYEFTPFGAGNIAILEEPASTYDGDVD